MAHCLIRITTHSPRMVSCQSGNILNIWRVKCKKQASCLVVKLRYDYLMHDKHCCPVNKILMHCKSLIIRTKNVIDDIGDMNSRNSIIGVIPSPTGRRPGDLSVSEEVLNETRRGSTVLRGYIKPRIIYYDPLTPALSRWERGL